MTVILAAMMGVRPRWVKHAQSLVTCISITLASYIYHSLCEYVVLGPPSAV